MRRHGITRLRSHGAIFLVAAAAGMAAACGGGSPPPEPPQPRAEAAPLDLDRRLYASVRSAFRDSVASEIRSTAELARYWEDATRGQATPPPPPELDFGSEMALIVAAGEMPSGSEIRVVRAEIFRLVDEADPDRRSEEALKVYVRTTRGCGTSSLKSYPVEIWMVRRFDGPVVFEALPSPPPECRSAPRPMATTPDRSSTP